MKKLLISCLSLCLCITAGCMHFSWGYAPSEKTKTYDVSSRQKVPLMFYVVLEQFGECGSSASDKAKLAEKIKKSLEKTGLFSSVQYNSSTTMRLDNYNVVFRITRSFNGRGLEEVCLFWMYTLCLVPAGENYYLDGNAIVNLRGRELATFGEGEELTCLYWLPCAVAYPIANGYFVWGNAEDRVITALVNDFTKYHMENFRQ